MKTIFLVSCSSEKNENAQTASELYSSDWFKKAKRYAETNSDEWFILSAKFGIVRPEEKIENYNELLNEKSSLKRRVWFARATERMMKENIVDFERPESCRFVILAGKSYREHFVPELEECGFAVELPLEGKGIGDQKKWLKNN